VTDEPKDPDHKTETARQRRERLRREGKIELNLGLLQGVAAAAEMAETGVRIAPLPPSPAHETAAATHRSARALEDVPPLLHKLIQTEAERAKSSNRRFWHFTVPVALLTLAAAIAAAIIAALH
jgi:hypothetical protein